MATNYFEPDSNIAINIPTEQFKDLFEKMLNGFAYHEIILNEVGVPIDYIFLEVNTAFEEMTGLKRKDVIGKRVTEVLPGIQDDPANWIQKYGNVALGGGDLRYENYAQGLKKWYSVYAYSPQTKYFAVITEDITLQKKGEEDLFINKKRFELTQELVKIGVVEHNLTTDEMSWSKEIFNILEKNPEETLTLNEYLNQVFPDDLPKHEQYLKNVDTLGQAEGEYRMLIKNEKIKWIRLYGKHYEDPSTKNIIRFSTIQDITKYKLDEIQLEKSRSLYFVLSDINQAIVRIRDEKEIFQKACEIIVKNGKFLMAWIGLIDENGEKINVIAHAGITQDYLDKLDINLKDEVRGSGPTGTAAKTGQHQINNDFETNNSVSPWKDAALKTGYKSSASFPLKSFTNILGVLSVYSDEKNYFNDEEIRLLDELAFDLSFMIEYNSQIKEKVKTEKELEQSEEILKFALESEEQAVWDWDVVKDEMYVSQAWKDMVDFPQLDRKMKSEEWLNSVHPDDVHILKEGIDDIFKSGKSTGIAEYRVRKKDGTYFWTMTRGKVVEYSPEGKPTRIIGINADITPLKKAQEGLRNTNLNLIQKIDEMEKLQKVLIERENKMVELKEKLSQYEK